MLHGITVQYLVHQVYMCVDLLSLNCTLQNVDTNNGKAFLNGIHSSLLVLDTIFSLYHLLKNKHYFHRTNFVIFYRDRKSTRLNSSHVSISYAVFCLKKKK